MLLLSSSSSSSLVLPTMMTLMEHPSLLMTMMDQYKNHIENVQGVDHSDCEVYDVEGLWKGKRKIVVDFLRFVPSRRCT